VGVTASGLGERDQLAMFDGISDDRQRRVVVAADELRHRFGTRAVTRARLVRTGIPAPFERDLGTAVERRGTFDSRAGTGRKQPRGETPPAPSIEGADDGSSDVGEDPAEREFDQPDA